MSLQNNIGSTIRALRAQRNVSQEKLALETGIGRRYMSDIENGRRNVSLETIEKLAGFFEISASELGHVIYSYPRMLEHLVLNDGMTYEEAAEFIDYNTIGALPCMGEKAPIILNEIIR